MSSQGASEGALPEERGGEGSFLAVAEPVFSYRNNIVYLYITLLESMCFAYQPFPSRYLDASS